MFILWIISNPRQGGAPSRQAPIREFHFTSLSVRSTSIMFNVQKNRRHSQQNISGWRTAKTSMPSKLPGHDVGALVGIGMWACECVSVCSLKYKLHGVLAPFAYDCAACVFCIKHTIFMYAMYVETLITLSYVTSLCPSVTFRLLPWGLYSCCGKFTYQAGYVIRCNCHCCCFRFTVFGGCLRLCLWNGMVLRMTMMIMMMMMLWRFSGSNA